jgi:hypothetical protein
MKPASVGATWVTSSGWRSRNCATIAISLGKRSTTSGSITAEAQSGSRPTSDLTFKRIARPSGSRSTS